MAEEEIRYPDGRIEHPSVRTEHSDASFPWILGIILSFACLAALIHAVLLWFFYDYRAYEGAIKKSPYPLAPTPAQVPPRSPRLEQIDRIEGIRTADVYFREASNEKVLHSYGEVAGESGFVHVPVEQAMTVLLEKKQLRSRKPPGEEAARRSNGLVDSGESNSGRMFRKEPRWFER
jgi:hypothetical protein